MASGDVWRRGSPVPLTPSLPKERGGEEARSPKAAGPDPNEPESRPEGGAAMVGSTPPVVRLEEERGESPVRTPAGGKGVKRRCESAAAAATPGRRSSQAVDCEENARESEPDHLDLLPVAVAAQGPVPNPGTAIERAAPEPARPAGDAEGFPESAPGARAHRSSEAVPAVREGRQGRPEGADSTGGHPCARQPWAGSVPLESDSDSPRGPAVRAGCGPGRACGELSFEGRLAAAEPPPGKVRMTLHRLTAHAEQSVRDGGRRETAVPDERGPAWRYSDPGGETPAGPGRPTLRHSSVQPPGARPSPDSPATEQPGRQVAEPAARADGRDAAGAGPAMLWPGPEPARSGRGAAPAASPETPPPAGKAPPAAACETAPERRAIPAAPAGISLRIASGEEETVGVWLRERRGEVSVAVHSTDARLAESLREEIGELAVRLQQAGYRSEFWTPEAARGGAERDGRPSAGEPPGLSGNDSGGDFGHPPGGGQRRQQQGRRQPLEGLETGRPADGRASEGAEDHDG